MTKKKKFYKDKGFWAIIASGMGGLLAGTAGIVDFFGSIIGYFGGQGMVNWKKQARKWQRAFHALEDSINHGERIGKRIKPAKHEQKKPKEGEQLTFLL